MTAKLNAAATAAETSSGEARLAAISEAAATRLGGAAARVIPVAGRLVPILGAAAVAYGIVEVVVPYLKAKYVDPYFYRTFEPIDWTQWELVKDCGRPRDRISHNFVFSQCVPNDTITSLTYLPDEWHGQPTLSIAAWQLEHVGLNGYYWWYTSALWEAKPGVTPTREARSVPMGYSPSLPYPLPLAPRRPYGALPMRSDASYGGKPISPPSYPFSHRYNIYPDGTVENASRPAPYFGGARAPFYGYGSGFRPITRPVPGVRPIVSNPAKPISRPSVPALTAPREGKFAQDGASKTLIRAFSTFTQGLQDTGDLIDVVYNSIPDAPTGSHSMGWKVKYIKNNFDRIQLDVLLALYAYNLMEDRFVGHIQSFIDKKVFGGKMPGAFSNLTKKYDWNNTPDNPDDDYSALDLSGMNKVKKTYKKLYGAAKLKFQQSFSKGKENSL